MMTITMAAVAMAAPLATANPMAESEATAELQPATGDDRMDWWREARFGLFIHWGLYSIPAGDWNGDTGHAEWIRTTAHIPRNQYDHLLAQFNPIEFNADEWVTMAREAGMRYIVITSKHHDGFCLFDSAHTDFDIMSTPFQRDNMKELSDATRAQGLQMCWYHSIMDWHHNDYLPRREWEHNRSSDGANLDRFVEYLHAQVEELVTNYGEIGVMWFDGEWENTWTHEHGIALYDHVRALSPHTVINNRVDKGRAGMAGLTIDESFRGDFGTPEQEVPPTGIPGVDWESCITMNDHWGYNASDQNWKSTTQLIRMLVDVVSKGGNLLLNVGPKADGTFPDEAIVRLREIGEWMKVNNQSIYGTSASPFGALPWGRCTSRAMSDDDGNSLTRLYLHVFDWPMDGELRVPGLASEVRAAGFLGANEGLTGFRENSDVVIAVPAESPNEHCSVIVLDVAGEVVIYPPPAITSPIQEFIDLVEITIASDSAVEEVFFTIDGSDPLGPSAVKYEGPFRIGASATIRARGFIDDRAVTPLGTYRVRRVEPLPAATIDPGQLAPGLRCETFRGELSRLADFIPIELDEWQIAEEISLGEVATWEYVGRRFSGYLEVPADDVYVFSLTSDDGARLVIDHMLLIDNDGLHVAQEKRGTIALAKGLHPITVEWFNRTGAAALEVKLSRSGAAMVAIEPAQLFHVPE